MLAELRGTDEACEYRKLSCCVVQDITREELCLCETRGLCSNRSTVMLLQISIVHLQGWNSKALGEYRIELLKQHETKVSKFSECGRQGLT